MSTRDFLWTCKVSRCAGPQQEQVVACVVCASLQRVGYFGLRCSAGVVLRATESLLSMLKVDSTCAQNLEMCRSTFHEIAWHASE